MSVIAFSVRARADLGGANELVPIIDGHELTDMIHAFKRDHRMEERPVSYGGLIPSLSSLVLWTVTSSVSGSSLNRAGRCPCSAAIAASGVAGRSWRGSRSRAEP